MKNISKKLMMLLVVMLISAMTVMGCGSNENAGADDTEGTESTAGSEDSASGPINVISREDGSGTRGAFIELFGILQEDESGEEVDMTTLDAQITNNTAVMMTSVAGDTDSIGYISLGSLDDSVKALTIDGAEATVENVKSGTYKVSRPFNILTKDDLSEVAQDFYNYILSTEGQEVTAEEGYIPLEDTEAYEAAGVSGKVVVAGSSSVTPLMEKLVESYKALNADVEIEVQQSDSTTGVTSTTDGLCDIGMASRDLKDSETGLTATIIATDGIAVIVNKENTFSEMTSEQIKNIFTGEVTNWDEVK